MNMNEKIIIEPIDINDVFKYDKERFNSNNHWINDVKPDDYNELSSLSQTKNWIHKFRNNYKTITINNPYHIEWMKRANIISSQTGNFSKLFEDELDEFIKYFYDNYSHILPSNNDIPYFIRTEKVSLKYGQHGLGPYYNIKQIIESVVSSIDGHTPINCDTSELTLYLIPFNNKINNSNEFRVFVNNNKITAISQQNLYERYSNKNLLNDFIKIIINYFETDVKHKITWSPSYTYDFAVITNDANAYEPYFIEPNGFGKEYPAGSALFHWLIDEDKLYGVDDVIYVRYTY